LAGAATLWSLGGLLIKWVDWHPLAIAGVRSAIAAVTMTVLLPRPRFTFSAVQWGAAICYVGTVALFVCATKWTTAANAIFLQYTAPVYIALFSTWYSCRLRRVPRPEREAGWGWACWAYSSWVFPMCYSPEGFALCARWRPA